MTTNFSPGGPGEVPGASARGPDDQAGRPAGPRQVMPGRSRERAARRSPVQEASTPALLQTTIRLDRLSLPTAALPLPPELPEGLASRPRVLQLIDADAVSHGLVDGTALERASDGELRLCLYVIHATASALDPHARVRCAASSQTATHHLDVLTASGNNTWSVRRGLDGADHVLLEELNDLAAARMIATRPGRKRPSRLAELVILVAQDRIYTSAIKQLRLLGSHLAAGARPFRRRLALLMFLRRLVPQPGSPRLNVQGKIMTYVPFRRSSLRYRYPRYPRYPRGRSGGLRWLLLALGLVASAAAAYTYTHRSDVTNTPAKFIIAATGTANEPRPGLPGDVLQSLRSAALASTAATAYVINPGTGLATAISLTPRLPDGQVDHGPYRSSILAASITRVQHILAAEQAQGPFSLLATIIAAVRAVPPPATLILASSGLSTSGGLDFRRRGWYARPGSLAAQLKGRPAAAQPGWLPRSVRRPGNRLRPAACAPAAAAGHAEELLDGDLPGRRSSFLQRERDHPS